MLKLFRVNQLQRGKILRSYLKKTNKLEFSDEIFWNMFRKVGTQLHNRNKSPIFNLSVGFSPEDLRASFISNIDIEALKPVNNANEVRVCSSLHSSKLFPTQLIYDLFSLKSMNFRFQ